MKVKSIVFADLDGTFLDDNYGYQDTMPFVNKLISLGASIIFCSSKTRNEIEYYLKELGLKEPFISENGAAIHMQTNYFPFDFACLKTLKYNVVRLGFPYAFLRAKLEKIARKTTTKIIGFGDMTAKELSREAGLPLKLSKLAKNREYDEPFQILNGSKNHVFEAIQKEGLRCTEGGKYFHLTGSNDKGKAVRMLQNFYRRKFRHVVTYGVGDGPNDLPMLKVVQKPFFIKRSSKSNSRCGAWRSILHSIEAGEK